MADRVLFISWGDNVPQREERALEVFNEALGYYGRLQQEGRIERFDVVLLEPNGGHGGYMVLHGTHQQLDAVREDDEFRDVLTAASLVVEGLCAAEGVTDAGLAREVERFQAQIAKAHAAT
jgi:hypothetical protein